MEFVSRLLRAAMALFLLAGLPAAAHAQALTDAESREIAEEAYVYAYPIVMAEMTRRAMTAGPVPMNALLHRRAFPGPSSQLVVRPNADTLYSALWFDVSRGPVVVDVPDAGERYYMIQLLDLWTDTFASIGTRTTGNRAQRFAIVGPDWQGRLADGIQAIRSPTPIGLMIVRPQTNGVADYAAVRLFQDGLAVQSLAPSAGAAAATDPSAARISPVDQVDRLDAPAFFGLFAALMATNPPHQNDQPVLARIRRLGFVPGQPFDFDAAPPALQQALRSAASPATARIRGLVGRFALGNGWTSLAPALGAYGTNYLSRAAVAFSGFGMNVPEDAVYPTMSNGPDGRPLDSAARYVLHFAPGQLPPARAFWSVTMYDARQFFTANPVGRYALGDRDDLAFNPDGSLDLYIQRESPGAERERNWLPSPAEGPFSLTLRLYWPEARAVDGSWLPPTIRLAE